MRVAIATRTDRARGYSHAQKNFPRSCLTQKANKQGWEGHTRDLRFKTTLRHQYTPDSEWSSIFNPYGWWVGTPNGWGQTNTNTSNGWGRTNTKQWSVFNKKNLYGGWVGYFFRKYHHFVAPSCKLELTRFSA